MSREKGKLRVSLGALCIALGRYVMGGIRMPTATAKVRQVKLAAGARWKAHQIFARRKAEEKTLDVRMVDHREARRGADVQRLRQVTRGGFRWFAAPIDKAGGDFAGRLTFSTTGSERVWPMIKEYEAAALATEAGSGTGRVEKTTARNQRPARTSGVEVDAEKIFCELRGSGRRW